MKHVVSFSGGAASFIAAARVVERYGADNTLLVFCDTTIEDADLYRFVDDAVATLGCEIVKLRDGRDPWEIFRKERYMGNSRIAHCTVHLKAKPFAKWLKATYTPAECTLYFGFDWTEEHRLREAQKNWAPYQCEAPLIDMPHLSRSQVFDQVQKLGVELPRLYKLNFLHNNCGGFCVRAGQAHYENLLRTLPDVYAKHERNQEALMADIPTARPFLRKIENGVKRYVTLREFRTQIENGGNFDMFDVGGCGCFSGATEEGIKA